MAASRLPRSDGSRQRPEFSDERAGRALAALGDPDCRELLALLADGPRTAAELAEACDLPSTTLYRKLDLLVEGGLVAEGTQISTEGRNATLYRPRVRDLSVHVDPRDGVELEPLDPPGRE